MTITEEQWWLYVMSDGDPSLEEDIPKPLLAKAVEENVFTPKITTPIYTGGVKLHHKRTSTGETESFLSDEQRNDLAFSQLFNNGNEGENFHEVNTYKIRDYTYKILVHRDFPLQ